MIEKELTLREAFIGFLIIAALFLLVAHLDYLQTL